MSRRRVVLVVDSAKERALIRLGLEVSGNFEVVGVAVAASDAPTIIDARQPDAVLIDLTDHPDRGAGLVETFRTLRPVSEVVTVESLVHRHRATSGDALAHLRPAQLAALLETVIGESAVLPTAG